MPSGEYYSFNSKYNDKKSETLVEARISEEQKEEIKKLAKKAFLAIDGNGLSRVDFFVENNTNKLVFRLIDAETAIIDCVNTRIDKCKCLLTYTSL